MTGGESIENYIWNTVISKDGKAIYDIVADLVDNTSYIKSNHCPSNYQSDNNSRNTTVDSSNYSSDNTSKNDSASGNSAVYDGQNQSVGTRNSSVNSSKNSANYRPVDV